MKQMNVYAYQFMDFLGMAISVEEFINKFPDYACEIEKQIDEVKSLFQEKGWEGDGELQIIWLPPFLRKNKNNSIGEFVFHVKQQNNGSSFIASPVAIKALEEE